MAVEIKVDGDNRTFFARCYNCGSDLNYKVADIDHPKVKKPYEITPADMYLLNTKAIICPKCACRIPATLTTEEEHNILTHLSNFQGFGSCV